MTRSSHVQNALNRVESWPQWKQEVIKQVVEAHKPAAQPASATIVEFPLVSK